MPSYAVLAAVDGVGQATPVWTGTIAWAVLADPGPGESHLYRTGSRAEFVRRYPKAGPLLTRRLNTELLTASWG